MRSPLLRRFLVACVQRVHILCLWLLQTLVAQKDFPGADRIFGTASTESESAKGNFSLLLHNFQPFNFTVSLDGKTISFRAPQQPEENYQKGASIIFVDANGAVSEQENVLLCSGKVLLTFGSMRESFSPLPDRLFIV
jgi:hypothetical protein